jgi:hypothetical protein
MKKWVWFTLLAIVLFAVLLRVLPLAKFAIWGSDTGEYYFLTNALVEDGSIPEDYNGWGFGYPYFPGMFYLTGAVAMLAGTDLLLTLLVLTPVLSTLSVVFIFMLTRRIGGSNKAGLIAAAMITVSMPNVLTTSHAMPGALGDMLVLLCIFLLLQSYERKLNFILLILASMALIITHHLSTFILIISVIAIVAFREILKLPDTPLDRLRVDRAFLFISVIATIMFWQWYAEPFTEGVIERSVGSQLSDYLLVFAIVGLGLFYLIMLQIKKRWKYRYSPPVYTVRRKTILLLVFMAATIGTILFSVTFPLPSIETIPDPSLAVYLIPFTILFVFGVLGPSTAEHKREGTLILAWAFIIIAMVAVAMATNNRDIIVFRYYQYGMAPWSIFVGLGLVTTYSILKQRSGNGDPDKKRTGMSRLGIAFTLFIIITVLAAGATAYPPRDAMAGFQEGIHDWELEGIVWCGSSLEPDATVATDHRLSSMLFGFTGINGSWDDLYDVFHGERFEDVREELTNTTLPAGKKRVDYVIISDTFKDGVALVHFKEAKELTPEAEAKFFRSPFYKIFDSGKVQVYAIDWGSV